MGTMPAVPAGPQPLNIRIDSIDHHPDNPRLSLRQDVIDAIAASLKASKTFPKRHAIYLRPQAGGRYQLLSGHHRLEAAKAAGLQTIRAWVDEVDDQEARYELVRSNNQGELAPLEIGLHALKCVQKGIGGAGNKGGISEFAKAVGRSKSYLTRLVHAAEVHIKCCGAQRFIGPTTALSEIHRLPEDEWQSALEYAERTCTYSDALRDLIATCLSDGSSPWAAEPSPKQPPAGETEPSHDGPDGGTDSGPHHPADPADPLHRAGGRATGSTGADPPAPSDGSGSAGEQPAVAEPDEGAGGSELPDEPESEETLEDLIRSAASDIEAWCRDHCKPAIAALQAIDDPWLDVQAMRSGAVTKIVRD